jgi:hypothetical protein
MSQANNAENKHMLLHFDAYSLSHAQDGTTGHNKLNLRMTCIKMMRC